MKNKDVLLSTIFCLGVFAFVSCAASTGGDSDSGSSSSSSSSLDSYVSTKYANGGTTAYVSSQSSWNAINCHDPKLFQDDDGTYYVYATDASCGNNEYTGLNIRYSSDLVNWKTLSYSALKGNWDQDFLAWEGFTAKSSDVKHSNTSYTAVTWAPTVIKQNGLYYMYHGVNADVTMTGNSKTYACSSIVLAIAKSAKGPFYPASYISSYSGSNSTVNSIKSTLEGLDEGRGVSYSQNFLVRYCPYSIGAKGSITSDTLASNGASLDGSDLDIPDYSKCNNSRYGCIDPEFVFDLATGELMTYTIGSNTCYAIIYGSWLNGIVLAYVDATSLKPVALGDFTYDSLEYSLGDEMDISFDEAACTSSVSNAMNGHSNSSTTDRFLLLGVPLIGGASSTSAPSNGYATAYEGAQLFYNSDTGYYYIISSCGALMWEYRCALGRSSTINGEYDDAGGVDMWLGTTNYSSYHAIGSKIIGSHVFNGDYSFRSQGGLSVLRGSNGKILFANHSRTNYLPEYIFYLQIHQMFFTDDGWPLLNLNDYYDDYSGITSDGSESLCALTASEISGTYNTILSVRGTTTATASSLDLYECSSTDTVNVADAVPTSSLTMTLGADGTVGGENYYGTWTLDSDGYTISIDLYLISDDTFLGTFNGYVMNTVDWARKSGTKRTLTFSTICSSSSAEEGGEYFWGNRIPSSSTLSTTSSSRISLPYQAVSGSVSAGQEISALGSLISSSTGLSVSFNLTNASTVSDNTYEWETPVKLSDSAGSNVIYIDEGPLGIWLSSGGENLFEAYATRGDSFTADNWTIFCQDGDTQFVTISFNTDGSIVYYKNGNAALTYAADTVVDSDADISVADGCSTAISLASSEGIILASTLDGSEFAMSNVIVSTAVDASGAASLYSTYGQ